VVADAAASARLPFSGQTIRRVHAPLRRLRRSPRQRGHFAWRPVVRLCSRRSAARPADGLRIREFDSPGRRSLVSWLSSKSFAVFIPETWPARRPGRCPVSRSRCAPGI
jgi:hypothetical protein